VAPGRVGPVGDRRRGAVEGDGHDHDRDAGEQRQGRVRVEPVGDHVAQPAPADQAGDHDQREGEHDRLVHRQQELAARQRQLHLEESLGRGGAQRLRRLDRFLRDAADAERRDPHRGRDGVDHRADHRRRRADREQDHDRHQVRKGRHDLHGVQHRCDGAVEPVVAACEDTERHPDGERQGDCRQHQGERLNALLPEAHQSERQERGQHDQRRAPASEAQHHERRRRDRADPGQPQQRVVQRCDEPVGERSEAVHDGEHDVRVRGGALLEKPRLRVVEPLGQLRPGQ
jgi:hypothetical protein